MEQKGIRTEKGDYNRHVQSLNNEIKQTKARIRKVKAWIYKYPIQNPPTMMEIYGGITTGKNLKSNWQKIRNLQTKAKVFNFLQQNNIASFEDFADTVIRKYERLETVTDDIKKVERRFDTLATHLAHAENINRYKSIYQKYKSLAPKTDPTILENLNPFTKTKAVKEHESTTQKQDTYYEKYAVEIEAYQAVQKHFNTVMNGRIKTVVYGKEKT